MAIPLVGVDENARLKEMKGEVEINTIQFPKDLGEEHPFSFELCEQSYSKIGIIKALVDKHVDFMVSPGFHVTSKNKKAETIIQQFIQDTNFHLLVREFIREGLVKGNAFWEIGETKGELQVRLLNANRMFLKRKPTGEVEYYKQYIGSDSRFDLKKVIDFRPSEIAHWALDKIGDGAYGYGLVYPGLLIVDNLTKSDKDLHTVMKRKAGTPYHWKLGNPDEPVSQSDVDAFTARLTYLTNKQDWVTDHRAEATILDFGNISDKSTGVLEHDKEMLFYVFQVPPVIMGKSDVTTDPSEVQDNSWSRRIQSLQASVEKVIEEKVFKRILSMNGLDAHVELEWSLPDNKTIEERILKLTALLSNPLLSENMRRILEIDLANNLGYEEEAEKFFPKPSLEAEQERREEEALEQPEVPGEKPAAKEFFKIAENFSKEELNRDYELTEYLGFNYLDFKEAVLEAIRDDNFEDLKGKKSLGLLTNKQVNELRNVMYNGFSKGKSVQMIAKDIETKVKPGARYVQDGKKKYLQFSAEERPIVIARTESTRLAGLGALDSYKEKGVQEKKWVAAISDRTCPICLRLDGQVVKLSESFQDNGLEIQTPPAHIFCRCSLAPITELG